MTSARDEHLKIIETTREEILRLQQISADLVGKTSRAIGLMHAATGDVPVNRDASDAQERLYGAVRSATETRDHLYASAAHLAEYRRGI